MLFRILWPLCSRVPDSAVQMPPMKTPPPQGGSVKVLEPWTVNPSSVTLSAAICTGPQGWSMIDSSVRTNARVLASTPAFAPRRVRLLRATLLALKPMNTCSAYTPGRTLIAAPESAAATAALIVMKAVVKRSLQSVALANPSSSTTRVGSPVICMTGGGGASVGACGSQAAPSHAIAGKMRAAAVLWSVCNGLLLEACWSRKRNQRSDACCVRSEEHTSELQSLAYLVCRLLLEKKKPVRSETSTRTPDSVCGTA